MVLRLFMMKVSEMPTSEEMAQARYSTRPTLEQIRELHRFRMTGDNSSLRTVESVTWETFLTLTEPHWEAHALRAAYLTAQHCLRVLSTFPSPGDAADGGLHLYATRWAWAVRTFLAAVEPQEQFTEDDALRIATAVGQVVYQECQSGGWTRAAYTIGRQIYWEIIDEKQQEQNAEVLVDAVDLKSAGG